MSIGNAAMADTATIVINPAEAANTAAATSGWLDVRNVKGSILFIQSSGAITGTLTGKIQGATDSEGTGAADISGATFTAVSAADKVHKCVVMSGAAPYMRYVGTIVTGPVIVGVMMLAHRGTSA